MYVHMCVHACGGHNLVLGDFLQLLSALCFETVSLDIELSAFTRLPGQRGPAIIFLCVQSWGSRCAAVSAFLTQPLGDRM